MCLKKKESAEITNFKVCKKFKIIVCEKLDVKKNNLYDNCKETLQNINYNLTSNLFY